VSNLAVKYLAKDNVNYKDRLNMFEKMIKFLKLVAFLSRSNLRFNPYFTVLFLLLCLANIGSKPTINQMVDRPIFPRLFTISENSKVFVDGSVISPREEELNFEGLERFEELMQYAKKHNLQTESMGKIMQKIADKFIGTPYKAGLLDQSTNEKLIISLKEFDCVLFVETVLAMSRGIAAKDYAKQTFVKRIENQRYSDGKLNGYCSRLHYFSEWIAENQSRGAVEDITGKLGGIALNKKLNFMSKHRGSYPQLVNNDNYQCIVNQEAKLAELNINYLPKNQIKSLYPQLQSGDIVAVATDVDGLDVTHTGLVYRNLDGNLGLIHASPIGEVTIAYDLHRYIGRVKNAIGIIVARPIDPRKNY